MSGGPACKCPESKKPLKERNWIAETYKCHHSAFNGYKKTYSEFSRIRCQSCLFVWRTKASYVPLFLKKETDV